jgi:peptidoglycan/LPS O-acetylase OafA/YrhL
VAAVWVVLSHGVLPLRALFSDPTARLVVGGFESTFSGIAAVMVFFIVSGFCIHLPHTDGRSISIVKFLVRRYVRIGVPLLVIVFITPIVGTQAEIKIDGVLWSIYAELVYYSIYPTLFFAARRFGWSTLIISFGAISLCLTALHVEYVNVQEFGWLTWLWGLPIWISGCVLAESLRAGTLPQMYGPVSAWRLAAWGSGAAATFLAYHTQIKIGDPISMLAFSILAYFWLSKELQDPSPNWRWLEWGGTASYSLYLVHELVLGGLDEYLYSVSPGEKILVRVLSVAIVTYMFYKIVEKPSHLGARVLAQATAHMGGMVRSKSVSTRDGANNKPSSTREK